MIENSALKEVYYILRQTLPIKITDRKSDLARILET